jgi:hypothetical protein
MKLAIASGTIGLGCILLVLASIWTSLINAGSTWTEEKSLRSIEIKTRLPYLGAKLHPPGGVRPGPNTATIQAEFDALQKENEELNAEFKSVHDQPTTTAKVLKWSGISLASVGLMGWYAVNQSR